MQEYAFRGLLPLAIAGAGQARIDLSPPLPSAAGTYDVTVRRASGRGGVLARQLVTVLD